MICIDLGWILIGSAFFLTIKGYLNEIFNGGL